MDIFHFNTVVSSTREMTINALRRGGYSRCSRAGTVGVTFGVCLSTTMNSKRRLLVYDSVLQTYLPRRQVSECPVSVGGEYLR
jgi:hypothetical protein